MEGRRPRRLAGIAAPSILAVAFVVWGACLVFGAPGRYSLKPPTRSLPTPGEEAAFAHGLTPADLGKLLADGAESGTAPDGTTVTLTLNPRLQKDIYDLFRRFDPPYGAFAAMEPKTGRVLALVGYRKGGESDPWLPLKAIYPAASLIKVVTAAAALDTGALCREDEISYCGGIYRITRRGLNARRGRGTASMTLEEAIARSANSVFGRVAVEYVGSERLEEFLGRFGFGRKIPFGLSVETSRGVVPSDDLGLARTGAGLGEVYVSPLHMAMIMSAIASSGEMPRPILIESVADARGGILYEAEPSKWRDTVSPETAETLLRMMIKTIEEGTSRRAFGSPASTPLLRDMEIAGKTGSLSGWNPRMRFEWFAGAAPVRDARIAVAALVVNGDRWRIKGSYVGREAFSSYFGYPHSDPPTYAGSRSRKKARAVSKKKGRGKTGIAKKRGKKSAAARAASRPRSSSISSVRR